MLIRHSLLKSEQPVLLVKLLYPKRDTEALPTSYSVTIISMQESQMGPSVTATIPTILLAQLSYGKHLARI